jgi:tetratricopeptide (TPR) repeat protein
MIPLFLRRKNALLIVAGSVCGLVLLVLTVLPGFLAHRPRPSEELQAFDGVLGYGSQTYDHIKADLYIRASRKLKAGDARGAEALYREIVDKYPGDPSGYEALGACLFFEDKYQEARAEYQHSIQLNPRSVGALYGLGCVGYKQARSAEAKDCLERALTLDPDNGLCHRVLGSVYEQMGDTPRALLHYERAVVLDPSIAGDAVIQQRVKALKE